MFKYEYGQLPDALNMFFLLRIDMCIITILETRTNSRDIRLYIYYIICIYVLYIFLHLIMSIIPTLSFFVEFLSE